MPAATKAERQDPPLLLAIPARNVAAGGGAGGSRGKRIALLSLAFQGKQMTCGRAAPSAIAKTLLERGATVVGYAPW